MGRKRSKRGGSKGGSRARAGREREGRGSLQFSQINALVGVAGLGCLILGFWLLAQGSVTAAPLLLVLAYGVLLPLAILL